MVKHNLEQSRNQRRINSPDFLRASSPLREIIRNYLKPFLCALRASVPPCEILLLCTSASLRDIIGDNK